MSYDTSHLLTVGHAKELYSNLKSAIDNTVGEFLFSGNHAYSGNGNENWLTFIPTADSKIAIILTGNTTETFELAVKVGSSYPIIAKISDNNYHIIEIPSGASASEKLIISYKGTTQVTVNCSITDATNDNLTTYAVETRGIIDDFISGTENEYGNDGTITTSFISTFNSFLVCPCKKVIETGKLTELYVKSYSVGISKLYVGGVDQMYLFVPRASYDISVQEGEQSIDVSSLNIYVNKGEQIAFRFVGQTPFARIAGTPEDDNSFYYSSGGMQLEVYGAAYAAVFGFGFTVTSSILYEQDSKIEENTTDINTLQENVSFLQSNFNVVSDRQGNKYRMVVQNNEIALVPMNYSHVLCVGNSYTIHPTTDDTASDYKNNLWWGHWAMAASAEETAWTTMLQNALRQKVNDAVVTPVFGRRYETNPTTYTLSNSNTFTYWTGSAWASLKDNVASFSDVDAVVFFLGANYSGNDWYSLYSDMVEQFYAWFPNATMFCCSCAAWSMPEKDEAIKQVALEQYGTYISMVGINGKSKIGSYVFGDDDNLHQIDNSAVGNHFGDYGEYLINGRICTAMGYSNNTGLYNITISSPSGVTLSVISTKTVEDAVVSVFAEVASGTTLSSITVTDASNNSVTVTDHGATDYGRVFTFEMPASDVTIIGTTA